MHGTPIAFTPLVPCMAPPLPSRPQSHAWHPHCLHALSFPTPCSTQQHTHTHTRTRTHTHTQTNLLNKQTAPFNKETTLLNNPPLSPPHMTHHRRARHRTKPTQTRCGSKGAGTARKSSAIGSSARVQICHNMHVRYTQDVHTHTHTRQSHAHASLHATCFSLQLQEFCDVVICVMCVMCECVKGTNFFCKTPSQALRRCLISICTMNSVCINRYLYNKFCL